MVWTGASDTAAPRLAILAPALAAPSADSSPAEKAEAGWRLVILQQKSAHEELAELIALQDWPAALALSRRHGLPADPVYKCVSVPWAAACTMRSL